MYTVYTNYVALTQQNEAPMIYPNYVASNLGGIGSNKVDTPCGSLKIMATAIIADGSIRDSMDNERQIHAKMLEQGTLHRCAMLQYNMARTSSAKL